MCYSMCAVRLGAARLAHQRHQHDDQVDRELHEDDGPLHVASDLVVDEAVGHGRHANVVPFLTPQHLVKEHALPRQDTAQQFGRWGDDPLVTLGHRLNKVAGDGDGQVVKF